MNIWSYWETKPGATVSDFQQLCFESVDHNNNTFRLIGPEDIKEMGGEEILDIASGVPVAQRSDLIRCWLIHEKGGVWFDSDFIATGPLDSVFWNAMEENDFVGIHHKALERGSGWASGPLGLVACPFGATPKSPFMAEALKRCREMIVKISKGEKIPYGATSVGLLSQLSKEDKFRIKRLQQWRYNPVPWNRARKVFLKSSPAWQHETRRFNPNACCWHLTNIIPDFFKEERREAILTGSSFASFLLQKSFGMFPSVRKYSVEILNRLERERAPKMLEVGVWQGANPRCLLHRHKGLTYVGVDPWKTSKEYKLSKDKKSKIGCGQFAGAFNLTRKLLAPFDDRVQLIRKTSEQARKQIPDQSVDLVFIDGIHSYSQVREDLHWAKKIKPGGWLSGHDYNGPREGAAFGVKQAVDEFASLNGLEVEVGKGLSWFIRIPSGPLTFKRGAKR